MVINCLDGLELPRWSKLPEHEPKCFVKLFPVYWFLTQNTHYFCDLETHCFVNINQLYCNHHHIRVLMWTWIHWLVNVLIMQWSMNQLYLWTWTHWRKGHESHYYYVIYCFVNMNPLFCEHEPIVLWTWTHCFVNMNPLFCEHEPIVLWTWNHCFVNMNHWFVNMNSLFCEHEPIVLWTWTHWRKGHETHYYYYVIIVLWKLTHCFVNMNPLVCEHEPIGLWTWTNCFVNMNPLFCELEPIVLWTWTNCFVNMNPLFCSIIDSHCFVSITWTHWFSLLMNINSKVPSDSLVHI